MPYLEIVRSNKDAEFSKIPTKSSYKMEDQILGFRVFPLGQACSSVWEDRNQTLVSTLSRSLLEHFLARSS